MMSNIGVAKIYKLSAGLWQIYWNGVTRFNMYSAPTGNETKKPGDDITGIYFTVLTPS